MVKPTLILMVGLPRSGKSTWARESGHPIVCPDAIRLAIHGQRHLPSAEPVVWMTAGYMVSALFLAGHQTVILDATNVRREWRQQWLSDKWTTVVKIIPTSTDVCKARAVETGQGDLVPVIDRMNAALVEPDNVAELRSYRWL